MSEQIEVQDAELAEVESESHAVAVKEDADHISKVIALSEKIDAYAKAVDTIQNAIIKRAFEGDFISHARENATDSEKKANIGAAAAERIARFLGIQESNWSKGEKQWSDDQKHYTWVYEADFGFQGRWVHAIGRASTQDKFFGYANREWKPLADIKEGDIKQAAFRSCRKEGVRTLLGLRNIPILKLKELGYDVTKIANAGFTQKLSDTEKATASQAGSVDREVTIKSAECVSKKNKEVKDYFIWQVEDDKGIRYSFFGPPTSKRGAILMDAVDTKAPVKLSIQVNNVNGRDFYSIVKVNGLVDGN